LYEEGGIEADDLDEEFALYIMNAFECVKDNAIDLDDHVQRTAFKRVCLNHDFISCSTLVRKKAFNTLNVFLHLNIKKDILTLFWMGILIFLKRNVWK